MIPSPIRAVPRSARLAGSGTEGGGGGGVSTKPALVNGVCPTSPVVAQPVLLPVPARQSYAMMYEPLAAPLSPIVIGLPDVRLVLRANAYRVKLVGAAKQ